MLGRDTEWRQGSLLTDEDAHSLSLVDTEDPGKRVIVISHDCDMANDTEEFVEVIIGDVIGRQDPMFAKARNPRRLHICFIDAKGSGLCLDLHQARKRQISKTELARLQGRDDKSTLSDDEKRALKQWLAARYGRPAFPNVFENRLRKSVGRRKTVERQIAKILEPASQFLVGIFFDLGEERYCELPDGETYFLSITLAYDATEGGNDAREATEKVAEELRDLFEAAYGAPDTATEIALESCRTVADTYITLADLRKVDQWRLEYISLQEDEEFLSAGERSI